MLNMFLYLVSLLFVSVANCSHLERSVLCPNRQFYVNQSAVTLPLLEVIHCQYTHVIIYCKETIHHTASNRISDYSVRIGTDATISGNGAIFRGDYFMYRAGDGMKKKGNCSILKQDLNRNLRMFISKIGDVTRNLSYDLSLDLLFVNESSPSSPCGHNFRKFSFKNKTFCLNTSGDYFDNKCLNLFDNSTDDVPKKSQWSTLLSILGYIAFVPILGFILGVVAFRKCSKKAKPRINSTSRKDDVNMEILLDETNSTSRKDDVNMEILLDETNSTSRKDDTDFETPLITVHVSPGLSDVPSSIADGVTETLPWECETGNRDWLVTFDYHIKGYFMKTANKIDVNKVNAIMKHQQSISDKLNRLAGIKEMTDISCLDTNLPFDDRLRLTSVIKDLCDIIIWTHRNQPNGPASKFFEDLSLQNAKYISEKIQNFMTTSSNNTPKPKGSETHCHQSEPQFYDQFSESN